MNSDLLPRSKMEWILCVLAVIAIGFSVYHAALIVAAMLGLGKPLILFTERGYLTAMGVAATVGVWWLFRQALKE